MEPVELLDERPRTGARPDEARPVGERELGAVGVQAWDDVEGARVEDAGDSLVAAVLREQPVDQVQRGGAARHLDRVDVGLDQERRLLERRPGLGVA